MNRLRDSLPAWFRDLPIGRQAIEQARAEDQTEFAELAKQLARLDAEEADKGPRLYKAIRTAETEVVKAKRQLLEAGEKLQAAYAASMGLAGQLDARRTAIKRQMQELSDGQIDRFIREMGDEHARLRKSVESREAIVDLEGGKGHISITNSKSVGARLLAIVAAQRSAEALRYVPGDHAAALEKLRDELPAIEPPRDPVLPKRPAARNSAYERQRARFAQAIAQQEQEAAN